MKKNLGFNMCEFGLEGVTIGISKKSSNKDKELKGTLFDLVLSAYKQ